MNTFTNNGNGNDQDAGKQYGTNRMFYNFQRGNPGKRANLTYLKEKPDQVSYVIRLRNLQKVEANLKLSREGQEHLKAHHKAQQDKLLNESLVKSIEFEYACRYLESLQLEANPTNITAILQKHPLSECEIQTGGWDNFTDMVDTVYVYPHRKGKHANNFANYLRDKIHSQQRIVADSDAQPGSRDQAQVGDFNVGGKGE